MRWPDFAEQKRTTGATRLRLHAALLAWATIVLVAAAVVGRPARVGAPLASVAHRGAVGDDDENRSRQDGDGHEP
jgi:hypothetical protein